MTEPMFACHSQSRAVFYIESMTNAGQFYLVEFNVTQSEEWTCDCPAFIHRHGPCKHIKLIFPRLCLWDQAKGHGRVVRRPSGRLCCPVCGGDVFTYWPKVVVEGEF